MFALTWLILLVNSTDDFNMASTRKKKQQNKKLPSQLSESDADFIIGQSRHEAQTENRSNRADGDTSFLKNANSLNQVSSAQVKMTHLRKSLLIISEVKWIA